MALKTNETTAATTQAQATEPKGKKKQRTKRIDKRVFATLDEARKAGRLPDDGCKNWSLFRVGVTDGKTAYLWAASPGMAKLNASKAIGLVVERLDKPASDAAVVDALDNMDEAKRQEIIARYLAKTSSGRGR